MNIDVNKESICVNKIVGQKSEVVLVEGDVIVPDIKPDIINTISTNGNVCIYKKEIMDGKVRIDGCVNTYMIYLSDTEEAMPRGLNACIDFTQILDLEDARTDMDLDVTINLKNIECKVLNGRKVNMKASVEFNLRVYSIENVEILKEVKNMEEIQKLNKCLKIDSLLGRGSSKTYAKDTLSIDNVDNFAEILKVEINITNTDMKVSYNKVLAKADCNVKIMYLTEDNRISNVEGTIPVMGFIDVPNVSEENMCDMKYALKNLIIKPNDVTQHSIYVEAEVEFNCHVYETKEISAIQDLYSPECNINFTEKNVNTMIGMQNVKDVCNIRENIVIPELNGNKIYNVDVNPIITNSNIANDKVRYEGEMNINVLFASNNASGIDSKMLNMPFNFEMIINGVRPSSDINTTIDVKNQNFIVMSDGNIDCKIDLEFGVKTSNNVKINIIDKIEAEEVRENNIYSVVIYFVKPGDTLWNIAKRFKSTVEDIARANEIVNENKINVGQQLFIPRYVAMKKVKQ